VLWQHRQFIPSCWNQFLFIGVCRFIGNDKASLASSVSFILQRDKDANVMIKAKLALAATIVLGSTVVAGAQVRYYDRYLAISPQSTGAPPRFSENPRETGGGSIGYNDNLRKDDW
jgi:hypothetical protein